MTRAAGVCRVNRARRSSGPVRSRALAWPFVRVRSPAALRRATISARIASTAPSRPFGAPRARPDCAARAALTASSGSDIPCRRRSCRSERSTPAHPDASCGDMASQSGAVTASPFDAGQGDGPEPAQPAQQAGIASWGGRELPDTEQPADGIQRGGDMDICVGVHAAGNCGATGNGACFFYDGHSHPFLRLRGGTHPLAHRTCEPRPLVQAGQIRPAPLAGAIKPGARPTDRLAGQPGRRQPNRRSGRDPGSRRYAPVQSRSGKPRQKHYPQSPCRILTCGNQRRSPQRCAQII